MKKKYLPLVLAIAALSLYSCEISFGGGDDTGNPAPNYPPRTFWASNFVSNSPYRLTATAMYEGSHCVVWAEQGSGVSSATARTMANAYDRDIYPKMINTFSVDLGDGTTMEMADVDGDGKLTILLLDIQDGYNPVTNTAYAAGYFYAANFFSQSSYSDSNQCDMIFVDTYPAIPGSQDSNQTLAHEMQHLMNFVNSYFGRVGADNTPVLMDTWIDEGLSSAAEYVYAGGNPSRVDNYTQDISGLIKEGNNFFVWDNHANNNLAILDDYSTVYLFFQWLRLQSSSGIYSKISGSPYGDYRAVTRELRGDNDWGTVLKTWLAANYINAPSGALGYKGASEFAGIRAKTAPAGRTSYSLAPGEGVYSATTADGAVPGAGTNIRYAGLGSRELSDTSVYQGGALLTYNANADYTGGTENGQTTGVAASVDIADADASRAVLGSGAFSGPFRIDARDILRRNGHRGSAFNEPKFNAPVFSGGFVSHE